MHTPENKRRWLIGPAIAGGRSGLPMLMRGESAIASAGLALAATFMMAIGGAGVWTVISLRQAARAHLTSDINAWAQFLAGSAESKLAAPGGVLDVRSDLIRLAAEHDLERCRIVLGDGKVLADGVAGAGSHTSPSRSEAAPPPTISPGAICATAQLAVPAAAKLGAGPATIELAARPRYSAWVGLEAQAGVGVIGVAGFLAFLGVYRHLRARLRAVGAIREALLVASKADGPATPAAALVVSEQFGPEAAAWNAILAEREHLRRELLSERTRESLTARADSRTDVAAATDALWHGLLLLDDKLTIKYANGAAAVFLRAKRESMAGSPINAFVEDPRLLDAIAAIASGRVRRRTTVEINRPAAPIAPSQNDPALHRDDARERSTDGTPAPKPAGAAPALAAPGVFRYSIRPIRRDDLGPTESASAAALVLIEDITQQRIADDARNAFVAQATHELRTPLTNIRLYVEQAIEAAPSHNAADADPHVLPKALDVINHESRRLERIVADMLSVSEIEAGSFKLRTGDVRLENLFDDLKSEYEPQAAEKKIALTLRLPPKLPVIKGDRDKIVLALHNLLGNAVKYTPAGGRVEVRVEVEPGPTNQAGGETVKVSVADTGIGISPDETELIFEKFYRARDDRVSKITGTGLGLALAREVVRLHGGDITVQSELDKGSTFTMTIPNLAEAA